MPDITIGSRVWVRVPTSTDPGLQGQELLRKPGPKGPRGRRYETTAEIAQALQGHPVKIVRDLSLGGYFTTEPEEVFITPQIMRHLSKGSLIMVDAPTPGIVAAEE